MSKLSFRPRVLDPAKPMPICLAEELPELPDYSVINRAVPQMPSGMETEEECEHHLQRAICAGLIIPTPEVSDVADKLLHDQFYPANYKQPRQLIQMQPFFMEQDVPDYDMDSEDERWLDAQTMRLDITPLKFEEMMDRLEKSSGQTVVTLQEAKALLKEDDDLIVAVFDYWLNKRLKVQHPLILAVKTDYRGATSANNPYIAFRRRSDKMQTRKIRKNDEASYEKMLKLRRDLSRAVNLLEFIKKREKMKRELLQLTVQVFEKRFEAKDFAGAIAAEFVAQKPPRPAFTPIFQNNYANHTWNNKSIVKDEGGNTRNPKRPYKKRKHKALSAHNRLAAAHDGAAAAAGPGLGPDASSDEETLPALSPEPGEPEDEGMFAFRRNKNCSYHMPRRSEGSWPWESDDCRFRYTLTSLANPRTCIGFARRRIGRGGRVIVDRLSRDANDFWRKMDYTVYDSSAADASSTTDVNNSITNVDSDSVATRRTECAPSRTFSVSVDDGAVQKEKQKQQEEEMLEMLQSVQREWLHFRPKTPPADYVMPCSMLPPEEPFTPSANTSFSLELKALDDGSADILTESTFVSAPFMLDYDVAMEVPVTDTRQEVASEPNDLEEHAAPEEDTDDEDDDLVGCSRFRVRGSKRTHCNNSSTFTSPKSNVVRSTTPAVVGSTPPSTTPTSYLSIGNANGLLSQFAIEGGSRSRLSKYDAFNHSYARSAPTNNTYRAATTVTLNSHSANILEIPLSGEASSKTAAHDATAGSPNSKATKAIVRKNLAMEVT